MTIPEMLDVCIQFIPSGSVGLLVGIAMHFNNSASDEKKSGIRNFIGSALTSSTLCIAIYGISAHFFSDEIVRTGAGVLGAIIGVDRIKDIAEKAINKRLER